MSSPPTPSSTAPSMPGAGLALGIVPPPSTAEVLWALAPAWLAVAWLVSKLRWIWNSQPEMQFGWIVLMLSAYLLWENWPKRPAVVFRLGVANGGMAVVGVAMLAVVQVYQAAFGTNAASLCGLTLGVLLVVAASVHLAFGRAGLRVFGFPFAFLVVAVPLPSAIQGPLTHLLQGMIASLNVEILTILGVPAHRVGSLIQLAGGTVGVDEACSGIRSLQSSIMATLFIGYLSLTSNLLRGMLFTGGVCTAVLGNLVRSLYLSFTANARGVAAVNEVHDAAGWSILVFTAAGVGIIAWVLARVETRAAASQRDASSR